MGYKKRQEIYSIINNGLHYINRIMEQKWRWIRLDYGVEDQKKLSKSSKPIELKHSFINQYFIRKYIVKTDK